MQTTAQFLLDRQQLARKEHRIILERLSGGRITISCSCRGFYIIYYSSDKEVEAATAHYEHVELMHVENCIVTRALEAIKDLII